MAMVVILVAGDATDVSLDSHAIATLAELGITSVELLRDDDTVALVADGWAFDAANSQQAVEALIPARDRSVATLHSVGRMWVS
ncbi:MAG: hypothetical protein ACRDJT_05175 [Actinomycetota bacterium]